MKDKIHQSSQMIDEPSRGLALLLATSLLALGICQFSLNRPRSATPEPVAVVYHDVSVIAPGLLVAGKVDVNEAGSAELVRLNGIGAALASRIIEHREEHGPFETLDDLTAVHGIGAATVEGFRDQACVCEDDVEP